MIRSQASQKKESLKMERKNWKKKSNYNFIDNYRSNNFKEK